MLYIVEVILLIKNYQHSKNKDSGYPRVVVTDWERVWEVLRLHFKINQLAQPVWLSERKLI